MRHLGIESVGDAGTEAGQETVTLTRITPDGTEVYEYPFTPPSSAIPHTAGAAAILGAALTERI